MSNATELLAAEFELLRADIISAYQASGQAVSGNWADTVKVEATPNGYSITAADYINGRGPGKPPPSKAIEEWLQQKGIAARLEKNMTISSLAFLIARKIGREGWKPKAGTVNIVDSVVTPERIQQMLDNVGAVYLDNFTNTIINYLKQAAL
jgi:hypothetical protein